MNCVESRRGSDWPPPPAPSSVCISALFEAYLVKSKCCKECIAVPVWYKYIIIKNIYSKKAIKWMSNKISYYICLYHDSLILKMWLVYRYSLGLVKALPVRTEVLARRLVTSDVTLVLVLFITSEETVKQVIENLYWIRVEPIPSLEFWYLYERFYEFSKCFLKAGGLYKILLKFEQQ